MEQYNFFFHKWNIVSSVFISQHRLTDNSQTEIKIQTQRHKQTEMMSDSDPIQHPGAIQTKYQREYSTFIDQSGLNSTKRQLKWTKQECQIVSALAKRVGDSGQVNWILAKSNGLVSIKQPKSRTRIRGIFVSSCKVQLLGCYGYQRKKISKTVVNYTGNETPTLKWCHTNTA